MSIAGAMSVRRGQRCDVYRPVETPSTGGEVDVTWPATPHVENVGLLIEVLSTERLQAIFGQTSIATARAFVPGALDVLPDDVIRPLSGALQGQNFRVLQRHLTEGRVQRGFAELALVELERGGPP